MKIWNWIIGKGKKYHTASWLILCGITLTLTGAVWIYEHNSGSIIREAIEWIIAGIIAWAAWRFILFIMNTWERKERE